MQCNFIITDGKATCTNCKQKSVNTKQTDPSLVHRVCATKGVTLTAPLVTATSIPGPGTILALMIRELGVHPSKGCTCEALRREMDRVGVDGCRKDREKIIGSIKANWATWGWRKYLVAAVAAVNVVKQGATYLNPLDVIGSLLDEAIRRAEEIEAQADMDRTWLPNLHREVDGKTL